MAAVQPGRIVADVREREQSDSFDEALPQRGRTLGGSRVKLCGSARVVEDDPELLEHLSDPDYSAKVERAIVFTVEAWTLTAPSTSSSGSPSGRFSP